MRGKTGEIGKLFMVVLCVVALFGCAPRQEAEKSAREQETAQRVLMKKEQAETALEGLSQESEVEAFGEVEYSPEEQLRKNEEKFYEEAGYQGVSRREADTYLQILMDDNIFQNGAMELTGIRIADMDGNGQTDMLVVVQNVQEKYLYGTGGLWFYMNEDEPYCFLEEECPYFGWYSSFWADLDDDGNVEITFCARGTGCGGTGDHYKAVFKYIDHTVERMQLPSDYDEEFEETYSEYGLDVLVFQEPETDSYSAYCACLDEQISFHAENSEGRELTDTACQAGGNVGGFYDLCVAEYEGKKVLQASEYLYGEGGISHGVAEAKFLITWDTDGTPRVLRWWLEEYSVPCANWRESRICYADGYYYYVSQMDHYYLYRCKEDGSAPQCLARAHAGGICVQGNEVFFINQTDGYGIYRVKSDGTGLTKLCDSGNRLQISAEYVYFCDTYHAEYDTRGLVTEEPSEFEDDFLYRTDKDGLRRELIATEVRQYVLSEGDDQNVRYTGQVYCWKWKEENTVVSRMDLDGQNEEELCRLGSGIDFLVYEGAIFYIGACDGGEKIFRFSLRDGETDSFRVPESTEFCIYDDRIYTLYKGMKGDLYRVAINRIDWEDGSSEEVYRYEYASEDADACRMSDLFATECGVFFRQYVSENEGCQWFRLTDDKEAERWEEQDQIPKTLPARYIEYGEMNSVMSVLESTEGYETYLSDDLVYEADHIVGENGEGHYEIALPQFNSRIPGYKKINQYFKHAYQEALIDKEDFFQMLDGETGGFSYFQMTGYGYVYIDESYITVAKYRGGYSGGIRSWTVQEPVTFDRLTGETVSMEALLGMTWQEASARLTASAYKWLEGKGNSWFFLREENKLAKEFDPEKFFLFPEGIGIYYEQGAIDCEAAGDYLFVVPWEELNS